MRYKLLGRTGLRVSELCLGAMIFGNTGGSRGASREEAARIIGAFAEAGGNFIDTANYYVRGESERIVGELVAPDRERWVIATKYGLNTRPGDPNGGGAHRKSLVRSLEESLRRLRTDYVDLYWVHIWDAFTPVEEVVRALDDVVRSGKALYVGVSDTPAWLVSQAVTLADERNLERFSAIQVPYSLAERTVERDLLPMARALDLAVTAWGPLGHGLLTGRDGKESELSGHQRAVADAVKEVAAERGVSASQVAIAWVLAQRRRRGVLIPLVGVSTEAQIRDNLRALEVELAEDELERLDAASRISPGFPLDFGGARLAYGGALDLIDDHRALVDPLT